LIHSLASLEKLVIQLRQKKQEATKLRKKAEEQVKEFRSAEKRSSSGLQSIDKKLNQKKKSPLTFQLSLLGKTPNWKVLED